MEGPGCRRLESGGNTHEFPDKESLPNLVLIFIKVLQDGLSIFVFLNELESAFRTDSTDFIRIVATQ